MRNPQTWAFLENINLEKAIAILVENNPALNKSKVEIHSSTLCNFSIFNIATKINFTPLSKLQNILPDKIPSRISGARKISNERCLHTRGIWNACALLFYKVIS